MSYTTGTGPQKQLDLRAAVDALVAGTPGLEAVYLFGSRVHRTRSLRSDIDLLAFGRGLSASKMNLLQSGISAYLDVFVVGGTTAVSAANQSMIPASTVDELLEKTSAHALWLGEWVGDDDFAVQDILGDYEPIPTVAVVGAKYLGSNAFDYLFVTALPEEYHAAVRAVGARRPSRPDRGLIEHSIGEIRVASATKTVAVVLLPAVGMVAAALTTNRLLDGMDIGLVVLVGITGGIQEEEVSLGDIVIPNNIFDYEMSKATSTGERLNPTIVPVPRQIYQRVRSFPFVDWLTTAARDLPRVHRRRITPEVHLDRTMACGSKVVADRDRALLLQATDRKTLAIDMESYGVAEACRQVSPTRDYLIVKGITDWADESKNDEWHDFACTASAQLAVVLIQAAVI